jgi:predicted nuclease of restriction endonuclease-like (RecB) superfamily
MAKAKKTGQALARSTEHLFRDIRTVLESARAGAYRAVNAAMVQAYWHVGRLIVQHEQGGRDRASYGEALIAGLAKRLSAEFGRGFDERNLWFMRSFYQTFPKLNAVRSELSWTHCRLLLRVEEAKAREWYMNEAASQHWSTRQLDRQISVFYYERLLASRKQAPVRKEATAKLAQVEPEQFLRDPYVLEFLDLRDYPGLRESAVEQAIIDNLQSFLLELGKGFCFVARQKRMRFEEEDFYVDLVFYNYLLRCFVLIDLKVGKLTHQDIGQMDSYVRVFDAHARPARDQPTIGLILCSKKNEAIARYSVLKESRQVFAAKYLKYLPTEEQWRREIERERRRIDARSG